MFRKTTVWKIQKRYKSILLMRSSLKVCWKYFFQQFIKGDKIDSMDRHDSDFDSSEDDQNDSNYQPTSSTEVNEA